MKEIRCAEVGFFPECQGAVHREDEEEVMAAAAEHGGTVHGMTDEDFTEENVQIIRSHIMDVQGGGRARLLIPQAAFC